MSKFGLGRIIDPRKIIDDMGDGACLTTLFLRGSTMPFTDYPRVRTRPRFLPETQEHAECLVIGLGVAATCVIGSLWLNRTPKPKLQPKPQPHRRVSVLDLDTGKVLISDVPYISEERWSDHQYFFRFKGGGERFLDLRGTNYRIIRREA